MRYFMFSFSTRHGFAEVSIKHEIFPNREYLKSEVSEAVNCSKSDVVFLNCFEFKNSEDYYNFIGAE